MYGYEPPRRDEPEGCWDAIFYSGIALSIVYPVIFGVIFFAGLATVAVLLLLVRPLYAIAPIAVLALATWYIHRRDKRLKAEIERQIARQDRPHR